MIPGTRLHAEVSHSVSCLTAPGGPPYLETVGMDDLVADGALHQHEVELVLLFLQCVLLARLFAHNTHRCVRQDRLDGHREQEGMNTFNSHYRVFFLHRRSR